MSGLSFPSCAEKGRESEFVLAPGGTRAKAYARFLRYSCTLFKSLKKSEASVTGRPVTAGSFLSVVGSGLLFQSRTLRAQP